MNIKNVLDSINKQDLIELIINYSNGGYFPLELFLMSSTEYSFSYEELEECWDNVVDKAHAFEDDANPKAADVLGDSAEVFFKQAQRLSKDESESLLQRIVDDLTTAGEDGIGMETDSDWVYLNVKDKIEKYLEGR